MSDDYELPDDDPEAKAFAEEEAALAANRDRIAKSLEADESSGVPLYRQAPSFRMDETGLVEMVKVKKGSKVETFEYLRCGPFEVLCWASDPKDNNPTLVLRFKGRRGFEKIHLFECTDIHSDRSEMARRLTYSGLHIEPGPRDRDALARYFSYLQKGIKQIGVGVRMTGWHDIEGHRVFVLPHTTIGPTTARRVYLQTNEASRYSVKGTLEDWQTKIGNPAGKYPHLTLAVSLSFTGPLMIFAGQVGIGLNFTGTTSRGKSTALQVATSTWANGGLNGGYIVTYQGTANAIEMLAMLTSDTLLAVDEMSVGTAEKVFELSYRLFSGTGRARLNSNATMKEMSVFRTASISTGELTLKEKIAEGKSGRKVLGGQEVRQIGNPVDDIFDGLAGDAGVAARLADQFKAAAQEAYGTAGPAFVRELVKRGIDAAEVKRRVTEFVTKYADKGAPETVRVANAIGLTAVAGEMAAEFGIVDWAEGTATKAAEEKFGHWVANRGGAAQSTADQIIETTLRELFMVRAEQFHHVSSPGWTVRGERIGFTDGEGGNKWWAFTQETWTRVLGSNEARAIVVGKEKGWLRHDKGQNTAKVRVGGGERPRMIVVTWQIFGDPNHLALWDLAKRKAEGGPDNGASEGGEGGTARAAASANATKTTAEADDDIPF
jgi:putative DNA primase/helicase